MTAYHLFRRSYQLFCIYPQYKWESDKICNHGDLKLLSDGLGDKLCNGTVITYIVLETYTVTQKTVPMFGHFTMFGL